MLESFNIRVILGYSDLFIRGIWATFWISMVCLVGALSVGIIACIGRISPYRFFSASCSAYIEAIRSTPLLAQLYFLYFGLPSLGLRLSEYQTGILALTINSGAYMAEIIRSGVSSIPSGQIDAAIASGFTLIQRLRYIILPQAIGVTVPPLMGQTIVLVKDSALLSLISVFELTRAGQVIASERFMPAEGFFTVAVCYLVIYYILKTVSVMWQKRLINR